MRLLTSAGAGRSGVTGWWQGGSWGIRKGHLWMEMSDLRFSAEWKCAKTVGKEEEGYASVRTLPALSRWHKKSTPLTNDGFSPLLLLKYPKRQNPLILLREKERGAPLLTAAGWRSFILLPFLLHCFAEEACACRELHSPVRLAASHAPCP